jgi:hypothetical protein
MRPGRPKTKTEPRTTLTQRLKLDVHVVHILLVLLLLMIRYVDMYSLD